MIKLHKIYWLFFLTFLLAGCIPDQTIEHTGIVNALGIDFTERNTLETTFVVFQFTEQSEEFTKIISGEGKTIQGATENAEMNSLYDLVPGKNKITVFGRTLAEQGIFPTLDTLARDPSVPDLMYLAISDTTAKELFNTDKEEISTDIGQYLHSVIERHSNDHNIPRKTLQDFLRIYYDIGHDNVAPIFEMVEGIPKQTKNALFKDDQIVGELSRHETLMINLMDLTVANYTMELILPLAPFQKFIDKPQENYQKKDEFEVSLIINKGKSKSKSLDASTLTFETNTKIKVHLLEQNASLTIENEEIELLFEKEIEKKLEQDFEDTLKKVQKLNVDPFGYGRYYRMTQEGKTVTDEEWREKIPSIKVNFNVDVTFSRHGAID